jgi:hypothetical protein
VFYYTVVKIPLLSCDGAKPEHSHVQQDAQHKNNENILQFAMVEKRHASLAIKICAQVKSWKSCVLVNDKESAQKLISLSFGTKLYKFVS